MPRPSPPELARSNRDAALTRLRELTTYIGLGAVALTAVASLIAATTIPGRNASQPGSGGAAGEQGAGTSPQSNPGDQSDQPSFVPPDQPPQPASGGGATAVSGGS